MDQQVRFFPNINQKQQTAVYRTIWLVVTTAVLILITIATPLRYRMLQSDIYNYGDGLAALGLSLNFFAAYFVTWELVVVVGSLLVAGLIVWKRADDWFAMLVALGQTLFGLVPPLIDGLRFANPQWAVPISGLRLLITGLLMAIFCLFPNGRFQPRWTRWLLVSWGIYSVGVLLIQPTLLADTAVLPTTYSWQDAAWLFIGILWFSVAIGGQLIRYRHHATPLEKQQMKWVLLGFFVLVLFSLISALLLINVPAINNSAINRARFVLVMGALYLLLALVQPAAITLAMLRYRLWDVDILLNRTLVYGGLTGLVTAVYILLVGGASALASGTQNRLVAVILATVVVLLGLRPLRNRWQTLVNRLVPLPLPSSLTEKSTSTSATAAPNASIKNSSPESVVSTKWRGFVRLLLLLFAGGGLVLLIGAIPARFNQLQAICLETVCPALILVPADFALLQQWGLSAASYAIYQIAVEFILIIPVGVLWLIIYQRYAHHRVGVLACLALVYLGVGLGNILWAWTQESESVAFWGDIINQVGAAALILLLFLFPNGRFINRWTQNAAYLFLFVIFPLGVINLFLSPGLDNNLPDTLNALSFLTYILLGTLAQIIRYRRHSNQHQRQQTKWVVIGISSFMISVVLWFFLMEFYPLSPGWPRLTWNFVGIALSFALSAMFPVSLGLAIIEYKLWDIDLLINRTLVYAGLSAVIATVYTFIVGGLSGLFQAQTDFLFTLVATGLIAVLFQPVRERLQRASNRLMFGERDDPYRVLSKLGSQLQTNATPEAMLQSVVATIATTLKLPYVGIELENEQGRLHGAATGKAVAETAEFPLRYQNETVGYLVVSPRSPSEPFSERERQLLTDIAGQTGAAAYSVRPTTALQRSREKLVLTREEERRRLRRDLHDGLGPTLASQTFTLDAALDLLESDPKTAAKLLQGLKAQNQETVADIRRLVYELRPPSLDELGLVGALQAHIVKLHDPRFHLTVQPNPLPPLSAAVEVAAYRILLEAITNVVRHANAKQCEIRLRLEENGLQLDVSDDGRGLGSGGEAGVGLYSMRERAEELGGFCQIRVGEEGGTRVTAVLPV